MQVFRGRLADFANGIPPFMRGTYRDRRERGRFTNLGCVGPGRPSHGPFVREALRAGPADLVWTLRNTARGPGPPPGRAVATDRRAGTFIPTPKWLPAFAQASLDLPGSPSQPPSWAELTPPRGANPMRCDARIIDNMRLLHDWFLLQHVVAFGQ